MLAFLQYSLKRLAPAVLWLILWAQPAGVWGQLSAFKLQPDQPVAALQQVAEDGALASLEEALSLARQKLARGQKLFAANPPEQLGAREDEVQMALRLLNARVLYLSQQISAQRMREVIHRDSEDLATRVESWQGFGTPPPYSILMVDDLRDARHAQSLSLARDEVKKNFLEQELADRIKILEQADQQLRLAKEAWEGSRNGSAPTRLAWLHDLAQLERGVAADWVLSLKTQLAMVNETLVMHRKTLDFLDRQIAVASSDTVFSQEMLDQQLAAISQKQKAHEDFQTQAIRDSNRYQDALHKAREALQAYRQSLSSGAKDPAEADTRLQRLEEDLEVKKAWVDTGDKIVELNKVTAYQLSQKKQLWTERYRLSSTPNENAMAEFESFLTSSLKKVAEYRPIVESSHRLTQALVLNQKKTLEAGLPTEWQQRLAAEKLAAYELRFDFLVNNLAEIDELVQLANRFQEAIADRRQGMPVKDRLRAYLTTGLGFVRGVWDFEIFTVDETVMINGQAITEQRPVTVSKVVRALLILIIGLWLIFRYEHRINQGFARLFKLEGGAALMVQQVVKAVLIFGLLVLALTRVKIPLTVFAFLGGALAIGVGFGAQALISNLISGFILLVEKPIKIGDQVEVEGTRGSVVSIGARCSQVRRFDGIDILVPNSAFLEKNIVNYTLSDQLLRQQVRIGVAYGSPTREVARIITNALENHGRVLKKPEPVVLFEDFGDSALIFSAFFWVEILPGIDTRMVASDLRHMLDKRFREAGITIAFPQLDVHFGSDRPIPVELAQAKPKEPPAQPDPGPAGGPQAQAVEAPPAPRG